MRQKILLPIVEVRVRVGRTSEANKMSVKSLALLDSGSDRTFCAKSLMNRMGIKGKRTQVIVNTMDRSAQWDTSATSIWVEATRGRSPKGLMLEEVLVGANLPHGISNSMASTDDWLRWKHLLSIKELHPGDDVNIGVEIIIGLDHPQALQPLEVRCGGDAEPFAVRTMLGWTLQGAAFNRKSGRAVTSLATIAEISGPTPMDRRLEEQVQRFWEMDEPTRNEALEQEGLSAADQYVINLWDGNLRRSENHYVLPIPFKQMQEHHTSNWGSARHRLESLKVRLRKDKGLGEAYRREVQKLLDEGYAERVTTRSRYEQKKKVWYLPHHPVINPQKPGKVRIVFDCAAEHQGVSLNKQVWQGPDLNNKLLGILLRFREGKIAMTADIEAMFYQVKVPEKDRDMLRFLWFKDGSNNEEVQVYRMTAHVFGGVWSPACAAYALQRTFSDHGKNLEGAVKDTARNFYVDDILHSVDDEEQAARVASKLTDLMKRGGFRLTKWSSNQPKVLGGVPKEDRSEIGTQSGVLPANLTVGKALGVVWDQGADRLAVRVDVKSRATTKRGLLATFSAVYDPLGIVAPFVVRAKLVFQEECRAQKGWDEPIKGSNLKVWQEWTEELPKLSELAVPRHYTSGKEGMIKRAELHTFADASQRAYGTVSYLRYMDERGEVGVSFIFSKSRLAPLRGASIPRLELCAAKLAVEVASNLVNELNLKIHQKVYWTDSMIVLQYINNHSRRFKTYVENRVAAIQRLSDKEQWRHVPSEQNPADDISRGLSARAMLEQGRWEKGPDFLREEERRWPETPKISTDAQDEMELRKCVVMATSVEEAEPTPCMKLWRHFSCWNKLTRAVAWLWRLIEWRRHSARALRLEYVTVEEMRAARRYITKAIQKESYNEVFTALEKGQQVTRQSAVFRLEPHLDQDGMLRVGGRLSKADISYDAQSPYLLPKDHPVTKLIVRHVHRVCAGHMGREHTIATIREKYWIPRIRPVVDGEIRRCNACRRQNWRPQPQREADLPKDRVAHGGAPFDGTGPDCFGPMTVAIGRRREKRWGCLFTCLSTRAIHLEVLTRLDGGDLLMAITRFTSRRGITPGLLRSDNGTNMVRARKDILAAARSWNEDRSFKNSLASRDIRWEFIPPGAPHMGGVWERQIGTVKKTLGALVGVQILDDGRLQTLFCEVERIVNNRPITSASPDPNDQRVLTPAHALFARGDPGPFLGSWDEGDCLRKRWRHAQLLADRFWARWLKEYLPELRNRQKEIWRRPNLEKGDIVLVTDVDSPRNQWPLARVEKVCKSSDGIVRRVRVRTRKGTLMRAPIKLCLLEGARNGDIR